AGRSVLTKLAGVMGAAPRETAGRLLDRTRVVSGPVGPTGDLAGNIQQALLDGVAVTLAYRDASGVETQRVVEPAGVFATPNGWYLAAWCRLRRAPRAFRLDRIDAVTLSNEPVAPRSLEAMLAELPYELTEPAFAECEAPQ
ncbi:MAG TPA: WYL domain-containing protein, partial [Thermomicrobiales bacterium]|nr:WYL domain-containing protein [Thermomicrobiales bacterium]